MLNSDCTGCFPADTSTLRSPCKMDPNEIPLPEFSAQQTANCPFLGTLTNEGIIPDDWMINETVWRATSFSSRRNGNSKLPNLAGHFGGNFRDHSTWIDETHKVQNVNMGNAVGCVYWYVNPLKMEGLANEHHSSVGISDCPTDWDNCGFDCSNAGEWKCLPKDTAKESHEECKAGLPNSGNLDLFIKALTGNTVVDESEYITTCDLAEFKHFSDLVHASGAPRDIVHDFHFENPTESFATKCNHSFFESDGNFLKQTTQPTGGSIGGSIAGGYHDLVHYFGESDARKPKCDDRKTDYFKLQVKDLRRIDLERKLPCGFDRAGLFAWMNAHNGITDRRSSDDWLAGC